MSTLLIRLAAPLQSWGADSKFTRRLTRREPTKSGVIGLCACAMGIRRGDDAAIARLAALEFGVRIDQPGTLLRDYQVAHKNEFWENGKTDPFVSERYYLMDAVFLAGVSGDPELLETIDAALQAPKFPLYLGRRSCPPSGPLSLGLREAGLPEALRGEPWLAQKWYEKRHRGAALEIVRDARDGAVSRDLPQSFDSRDRRYAMRTLRREAFALPTAHDPLAAIGGGA
jgi:CRISPR system Cascade subunit CasD